MPWKAHAVIFALARSDCFSFELADVISVGLRFPDETRKTVRTERTFDRLDVGHFAVWHGRQNVEARSVRGVVRERYHAAAEA